MGYFDARPSRAQALAEKYGGRVYDFIDSLLADSEIDAVSVCVANNAHAAVTMCRQSSSSSCAIRCRPTPASSREAAIPAT